MGFSCGCDDGDYEVSDAGENVHAGHKTLRCCECGCEIAPGHVIRTWTVTDWHEDGPFDDLSDEQQDALLEDAGYFHYCERCGDVSDTIAATGACFSFGDMWDSYREWLIDQGKAMMTGLKRYRPSRRR